jgi:hypothetical protein
VQLSVLDCARWAGELLAVLFGGRLLGVRRLGHLRLNEAVDRRQAEGEAPAWVHDALEVRDR